MNDDSTDKIRKKNVESREVNECIRGINKREQVGER
jgi:hypothetical protein